MSAGLVQKAATTLIQQKAYRAAAMANESGTELPPIEEWLAAQAAERAAIAGEVYSKK
jgi:hypothetical protein